MVTKQTAKSYICILANSKEIRKNSNRNHTSLYKPHRVNGAEMPVAIINMKKIADWCSNDRKILRTLSFIVVRPFLLTSLLIYMNPGRFAPNPVRLVSRFALGRFAIANICILDVVRLVHGYFVLIN